MTTFEQEDLYRAAQALNRDRAAQEVLRRLQSSYIDKWKTSSPDQSGEREDAYRMMRVIDEFMGELSALAAEPSVTSFNRRLARQS